MTNVVRNVSRMECDISNLKTLKTVLQTLIFSACDEMWWSNLVNKQVKWWKLDQSLHYGVKLFWSFVRSIGRSREGQSAWLSFQLYAVASMATFFFEAACERGKIF